MTALDSAPPLFTARPKVPLTLWIGLIIILFCEAMLFADVRLSRRGPLQSHSQIQSLKQNNPPATALGRMARYFAVNMTAIVWVGYLLFIEGILAAQGESPIRRRPHHFFLLALTSIFIWCIFDWINFYFIRAWRYIGFPVEFHRRAFGYFLAFATIVPGMLMTGQILLNRGYFNWARSPSYRIPRWVKVISLMVGIGMFLWPLIHRDPITNLTLWTSFVFLLDPINLKLGRPSMFRDWQNGWYGRTLAAFSGGLICGLLWEFWNYWALAKWTYHLPFLGSAEQYKYFEMPIIGLIGFVPFGIECWIMWQTLRIPLDGLAEELPDDRKLI